MKEKTRMTLLPNRLFNYKAKRVAHRDLRFLFLALGINGLIWGVVNTYIWKAPVKYTSEWSIILAGSGNNTNVDVNSGATANTQAGAPFGAQLNIDPRANYKEIALSDEVAAMAAQLSHLPPEAFNDLEVELVDPTATLKFSIDAPTAQQAQRKAIALQTALNGKLGRLRADETSQRELAIRGTIQGSKNNLEKAQAQLASFKNATGLLSSAQVDNLLNKTSETEAQLTQVKSLLAQKKGQLSKLRSNLNFAPSQVVNTFALQSDKSLQQNLSDYATISAQLTQLRGIYTDENPSVISLVSKQRAIQDSILSRAQSLLGYPVTTAQLQSLLVATTSTDSGSSSKEALYNNLITLETEVKGLENQYSTMLSESQKVQKDLSNFSSKQPTLQTLEQQVRLAEAVYTSALGKVELSKVDMFSTYPLLQLLTNPSVPDEPSSPKVLLALLGGAASSTVVCTALGLLWLRKKNLIKE